MGARDESQPGPWRQPKRWTRAALLLVIGLPLVWFGLPQLTSGCNRRVAMRIIERGATQAGAPTGLLGVKWLMTPQEVRSIRPDVHEHDSDTLAEDAEMFGLPVVVSYRFIKDMFLMGQVTFPNPATEESYRALRPQIEAECGLLPEPQETEEYALYSMSERGGVRVAHLLVERDGSLVQHLLIYRSQQ